MAVKNILVAYNASPSADAALSRDDLLGCWDRLKAHGLPFTTVPPATYHEMLEERLPGHGEPVKELQALTNRGDS